MLTTVSSHIRIAVISVAVLVLSAAAASAGNVKSQIYRGRAPHHQGIYLRLTRGKLTFVQFTVFAPCIGGKKHLLTDVSAPNVVINKSTGRFGYHVGYMKLRGQFRRTTATVTASDRVGHDPRCGTTVTYHAKSRLTPRHRSRLA
jgi:hypothetical protein